MKIHVEMDCTPEEMRAFLGLPDLKPMQASVMAVVERNMVEAASGFSPEAMLRNWLSLVPGGPDMLKEGIARFFRPPPAGGSGGRGEG